MRYSRRMITTFLTPAVVAYTLIFLYPTLRTVYLSFFKVSGFVGADMTFRGFRNYTELMRTPLFLESISNILKIWFIGGVVLFALVFMFTAMLSSGVKKKNFFRAIIYLPNLIPVVAMTTMWTQYIYNPRYGMLKTFFDFIGWEQAAAIQWTSQDMLFWGMLIAYIWGGVGWFLLIILAGVERIPQHFYEAARLDGANQFQMFFQITLPLLRDVLRITVVMWSITVLNLFAFAKVWTPVVQQRATYTPAIYMYELAFGSGSLGQGGANVGKAAAVGVMLLLAVLLISAAIGRILKEDPNIQY